jgi:hypothetical protein
MEEKYILHSSEFFGSPPHSMIVSQAGTQYSIRIAPETLVGTDFHSRYNDLLAQTKENERDENGLPKHPFQLLDIYKALQRLVWRSCKSVSETYLCANPEPSTPPGTSLQDYIQPPTLHLTLIKDPHGENGVVAEIFGDSSRNISHRTNRPQPHKQLQLRPRSHPSTRPIAPSRPHHKPDFLRKRTLRHQKMDRRSRSHANAASAHPH